jgi:hypothetical protein
MNRTALRFVGLCVVCLTAVLCLAAAPGVALGGLVNVIFTIDPTQSTESWSGTDNTYGAFSALQPGSLSTSVSGNFVLSFDPTNDHPATIQFVGNNPGNNNAYYQLANSVQNASPIINQPANLAGTTSGGQVQFALQNLVYSLNSAAIPVSTTVGFSQTFSATNPAAPTSYTVTSGGIIGTTSTGIGGDANDYVGSTGPITAGTWTLSESAAGSGQWKLAINGSVTYTYNNGLTTGTLTATGAILANATYSAANIQTVAPGPQTVTVPGNNPNAAVTATLPSSSTGGTLTVQQVPGITSLTQAAVTAGENNPVFALSTSSASIGAPQIWQVNYDGSLDGGTATLTFDFDPTTLPSGTSLSDLGIWHFDSALDQWEFLTGPVVDSFATLGYDTITIETTSFSPFVLGAAVAVPEPAAVLLVGSGLLPLALAAYRRKRHASHAQ